MKVDEKEPVEVVILAESIGGEAKRPFITSLPPSESWNIRGGTPPG
jgi:hypothetical protein